MREKVSYTLKAMRRKVQKTKKSWSPKPSGRRLYSSSIHTPHLFETRSKVCEHSFLFVLFVLSLIGRVEILILI